MRYKAAWVKVEVEVVAYADLTTTEHPYLGNPEPRRTVNLSFNETFSDDEGLDEALKAFTSSIREAARR